ncbi:hypothetical protein [Dryocola sp. BD626]|uniref:hypothetical protein n=1 Tax=Dryocola sp. BD626 TaxID=3133273 RepID=UPI003F5064AB
MKNETLKVDEERAKFERWYLSTWHEAGAWAKSRTIEDVAALRGEEGIYDGYPYAKACWQGWLARAQLETS